MTAGKKRNKPASVLNAVARKLGAAAGTVTRLTKELSHDLLPSALDNKTGKARRVPQLTENPENLRELPKRSDRETRKRRIRTTRNPKLSASATLTAKKRNKLRKSSRVEAGSTLVAKKGRVR